jgi:hypothetical protein|nr:MAG TPA: hypothetical protein [Caudoviricetes sp.]
MIAKIFIIMLLMLIIGLFLEATKHYPQCRWTRDPMMCVSVLEEMKNK